MSLKIINKWYRYLKCNSEKSFERWFIVLTLKWTLNNYWLVSCFNQFFSPFNFTLPSLLKSYQSAMIYSEFCLKYFKSKIYLKYNTLTQISHIDTQLGEVIKKNYVERGEIILSESILNISMAV